jgi:mono/diheme cytochrome c family protein
MQLPTRCFTIAIGLCATVAGARSLPAQPTAIRSTKDRVYSAAQALQGRDIYAGRCQSCHTAISHTGPPFRTNWDKRLLMELFDYMVEKMPKDSPGTLTTEEYTQVLAYILRMNGMPAGPDDLPSDKAALKAIRIDAPVPKSLD